MHIRKTITIKPAGRPNSEINVTPLVDVVLVLLIIFMVVTPLLEKDILVRVPETEQVEQPVEVPANQLVVSVDPQGQLSINSQKIQPEEYVSRLSRILAARPEDDRLVFFVADDKANYSKVIFALDGAKQAGAQTLGMTTELPPAADARPAEQ